ncbi:MAG: TonB-dependent receptor [Bacteroidaceae bacterium]|nr:TonB-dependent receptor [Bacteroidaceae bacterium]
MPILTALLLPLISLATLATEPADTTRLVELEEAAVFSQPKETGSLRQQPLSVSRLSSNALQRNHVTSLKGVGSLVPNLFIPAYGSRQTSAIYIRGIGSRINTPAVGLYVDNIPYYDKSAFDSPFFDLEQVEVLRGPQSTLFGRNTVGGVIRMHTRSPFDYQGTDIRLGAAFGNWERRLSATHYHRFSNRLALSAGGYYEGQEGFFRHDLTDRHMDAENAGGARLRLLYRSGNEFRLDGNVSMDYTRASAYPYYYRGIANGTQEPYPDEVGLITPNLDGHYRRTLVNAGLNAEWQRSTWTLNAVTAVQHISDRMFMDQDFVQADIYSLEQRQHLSTLSEEITLKQHPCQWWQGLTGASVYYQTNHTQAPVTFRQDGMTFLNSKMNNMATIQGERLEFPSDFQVPTMNLAAFHQSTFRAGQFSATAGLRLDYQRDWFDYTGDYALHYKAMGQNQPLANTLSARSHEGQLMFLPRLALRYDLPIGNIYGSVSRGYRSGGYNIQNVSELMQAQLTYDMIHDILDQPWASKIPSAGQQGMLAIAGQGAGNIPAACRYKAEYAWNYELGTHLDLWQHRLQVDASAYWSDIRNLQLSQMTGSGLGRIVSNAGRSRSIGGEVAMRLRPIQGLLLSATYGYTHATFRRYSFTTTQKGVALTTNYRGNHVPYMPEHTYSLDASYSIPMGDNHITLGANVSGAGRIYWTEANTVSQSVYTLLGARISYVLPHLEFTLWGKNLTDKRYDAFYFESMSRGYAQQGHPLQVGIDVRLRF